MKLRAIIKMEMLCEVETLAREVLPAGRKRGNRFIGEGPDGKTWSINLTNGLFGAWSAGKRGDVVAFVVDGKFGGDFAAMCPWAIARYSLDGDRQNRPDDFKRRQEQAERAMKQKAQRSAAEDARRTHRAAVMLASPGDDAIVAHYLSSRGLSGAASPYLRFGDAVQYDAGSPPHSLLPAMLAPVVGLADGAFRAVHRTFLEWDSTGGWRKISDRQAKLSSGPVSGHVCPLLDGAGVPWSAKLHDQEPTREGLIIAEGIENALSASLIFPGVRCCACLSHANLRAVTENLPAFFDPVIQVFDRDQQSRGWKDVLTSRRAALETMLVQGRRAMVIAAPLGTKDMNDHLQTLIAGHGYVPCWHGRGEPIDWRAALSEASAVTAGDPVACFWQTATGGRFGAGREPAELRYHPALPLIERPEASLPALLLRVTGESGDVGALVAWLSETPRGWDLAPLLRRVRLLGSPYGVVRVTTLPRRTVRGAKERAAKLVVGLTNALVVAHARPSEIVLCALDAAHATICAPGVPAEVGAVDLLVENDDVTLAGDLLAKVAEERLQAYDLATRVLRPWRAYTNFASMLRDMAELAA